MDHARQFPSVLIQAIKDTLTDHGPQWAAAVAHDALLSAFPLLLAASVAASVVDPGWAVDRITSLLGEFVPGGEGRVEAIIDEELASVGSAGLLLLGTLLWSGTRLFGALTQALNVAYDVDDTYGCFKRLQIELALLMTIGLVLIVTIVSGLLLGLVWDAVPLPPEQRNAVFRLIQGAVQALLPVGSCFLVYQFVPRGRSDRQAPSIGAVVAALLFLVAQPLFLFSVARFGRYNRIYGSLWIVIIILVWVWLVALIVFFGGEVASHARHQLFAGHAAAEVGRRHRVGSAA